VKFLIDMNLSTEWVDFLRRADVEAVHWSEIGPVEEDDPVIAAYAAANRYCVITRDLDFGELLATTGADGPSVVQMRGQRILPQHHGAQLLSALAAHAEALGAGVFITIEATRTRFRVLPIRPQ